MIKVQDYFNGNEITLYKYKITNLKNNQYLDLSISETNSIELEYYGIIRGQIENSSPIIKEMPNGETTTLLEYIEDFNFTSNDTVYDPLNPQEKGFYLFSFKSPDEIEYDVDNFYYINNGSSVLYDTESYETGNNLFEINFSNVKQLKNFDSNRIIFKKYSDSTQNVNVVEIKIPNSMLISDISFIGTKNSIDGKKIKNFSAQPILENNLKQSNLPNIYFYPRIINPIKVEGDSVYWFDSFNNYLRFVFDFASWKLDKAIFKKRIKNFTSNYEIQAKLDDLSEKFFKTLERCYYVTNSIMTSFAGFSDSEKNTFRETIYNGNNIKEYTDWQFKVFLDEADSLGNEDILMCFKTFIMMCSGFFQSSYCLKGGFTEEHKMFLPFYVTSLNISERTFLSFNLNSNFYVREKEANNPSSEVLKLSPKEFLNRHNIFKFGTNTITLPFLPNQISEVDISNSPLDFNTSQSLNFNFLLWAPSDIPYLNDYVKYKNLENNNVVAKKVEYISANLDGMFAPEFQRKIFERHVAGNTPIEKWKPDPIYVAYDSWFGTAKDERNWYFIKHKEFAEELKIHPLKDFYDLEEPLENWKVKNVIVKLNNPVCKLDRGGHGSKAQIRCEYTQVQFIYKTIWNLKQTDVRIYSPNFLYSNQGEYLQNNDIEEKELTMKLLFDSDFNLEKINLKSIYADSIKIKTNKDDDFREYKLSSASNPLNTTTKIYI